MITTRYRNRFLQTLHDWVGDVGDHPRELVLPEREFLCLAHELEVWVESAPRRYFLPPHRVDVASFTRAPLPGDRPVAALSVCVGDSFQTPGLTGTVTIRCLRKP